MKVSSSSRLACLESGVERCVNIISRSTPGNARRTELTTSTSGPNSGPTEQGHLHLEAKVTFNCLTLDPVGRGTVLTTLLPIHTFSYPCAPRPVGRVPDPLATSLRLLLTRLAEVVTR